MTKMKNVLVAAGLFLSTFALSQTTATATLNVKLNPLLSIQVNNPSVTIEYLTQSDYINGKSATIPNHITSFATGAYQVSVKSTSPTLSSTSDTMDLNSVTITADGTFNKVVYNPVSLSEVSTKLFESPVGGGLKNHNVTYSINGDFYDKEMETYTVSLVYEITAM